jgi:Tfp pilus assembly protein PilV
MQISNSHYRIQAGSEQAGFTIVETCIALVIMFVAVLGSVSLFAYSIQNNSSANDRELAMAVAQKKVEELRNASFTNASLNATDENGVTVTVTNAGRTYTEVTWITNSNLVDGLPTLKTITVQVTPLGTALGSVTLRSVRTKNTIGPYR